jgi:hypothetical protein
LVPLVSATEYAAVMAPFQEEMAAIDADLEALQIERQAARDKAEGRTPAVEPKRTQLELLEAFRGIRAQRDALQDRLPEVPMAYAVAEGKPASARIQKRGEPFNLGEEVPRGFLPALGGGPFAEGEVGSGRRPLAEAVASAKNPLTARVMVNRIWQHHFGKGLVQTPNDFGAMGRRPTHPELLDWLASRFIEDGWSVKKFQRRLIASATWQQGVQPAVAGEAGESSQEAKVTTDDGAGAGRAGPGGAGAADVAAQPGGAGGGGSQAEGRGPCPVMTHINTHVHPPPPNTHTHTHTQSLTQAHTH